MEVGGQFHRFLALVDEDEEAFDAIRVGSLVGAVMFDVGFANSVDCIGAREVAVSFVRRALDINDAELDAARDGVEIRSYKAFHGGEVVAKVVIQGSRDGGGAEDQLLE